MRHHDAGTRSRSRCLRFGKLTSKGMAAPLVVTIPYRFSGLTMTELVNQITNGVVDDRLPEVVAFDFGRLGFIEPAGIVFLSNLVHWIREAKREVQFTNLDPRYAPISFLDDSQFFLAHMGELLNPAARPRSTTIPYTRVAQAESHDWLDNRFIPWLSSRLNQSAATLAPFRVCISELFNNIADHTMFDIGGIAAQHFPQSNRIEIAVADFGLGIPDSVRKVRPNISHADAILLACQPGFTTQSTPRNRGAGLDYLLSVVGSHRGTLSIFSGNATVCYTARDDGSMVPNASRTVGYCPGSLIQIDFRTDLIVPVPEEEEAFEW